MRSLRLSLIALNVSAPGFLLTLAFLGAALLLSISTGERPLGLVEATVTRLTLARALGGARHLIFRLACLAAALNFVCAGLRERRKMRSLFGRFVPPEVVERMMSGPSSFGSRRCEVTVLLADIRDFTTLSEALAPEELLVFLNDYFSRMVDIIVRNGGCVDKFMGDGILAVFGAPAALEDHAARAVACALEMHFCLERFNAERIRSGLVPIRFGVALNTGPAVAGMVGSKEKMEYTVVGDTVNTVSRLEGLNSKLGTEILVTESTYKLTRSLFAYETMGRVCVRGRKAPVGVFQLIGPGQARTETSTEILGAFGVEPPSAPLTARRRAAARA
jgi:adenylate cyclase